MVWCWEGGEKQPTQGNGEFLLLFLELLPLVSESIGVCVRLFGVFSYNNHFNIRKPDFLV